MKIFDWLKGSNRISHLEGGCAIWAVVMFFGWSIISLFGKSPGFEIMQTRSITAICMLMSDLSVFIAMCAIEYTQKLCGNSFDWRDIFAGCLVPVAITVAIGMIYIII